MAKNKSSFQTIRTEGALFPPDILQRIASLKVDGTRLDDYHLPPGFKVKEAITASWTALRAHWTNFQEARANLDDDDTGTAITNDRWLLPLFKELDYGRLTTDKAPVIDEKSYPIERFYNHTPIHLIGCNLPLDRRTKGARGAATASPHSMMQEFLNRSDDHLWAFISNGRQLRILRDNVSLSRQAFVEFDLEAMMDGEVYSDFALMWLLCHQSRVEADQPEQCWLETWSGLAREQGTRILKDLRGGVEKSIEALGQGFISHPRNDGLRYKLQHGDLTKDDYYRQLLRIVYRLLFLFVAEDRELLHPTDVDPQAAELYDTYYSTRRLREMAERIRGSKHSDLWHSLSLVFDSLGNDEGCPQLGLIGLGSFLWRTESTTDLNGPISISRRTQANDSQKQDSQGDDAEHPTAPVYISNDDLLLSIRALAYVEQDRVLRSVDYRNLGSEELGSVYESLLELHPQMHVEAKTFSLGTAAGNERKTTGSYYTPDSLVQCLLDSALEPVVDERLNEAKKISRRALASGCLPDDLPDWIDRIPANRRDVITSGKYIQIAEQAILALAVCDPACGSGHFLISAAHRLARQLARVRTGESEPSPEDHQHALRDVIGRCIYGVDINPMAVELCKVSLWMEAIEPGQPLSFLDHHILCGNSLLGTTPALLTDGIPDDAYKPIEGDVKECVNWLKKRNNRERQDRASGQGSLFEPFYKLGNLPAEFSRLAATADDSPQGIHEKEKLYADLVCGAKYLNAGMLADTWCAVFMWKKDETDLGRLCPTESDFRKIENNPHSILPHVRSEVRRLADQYKFFHWHLAFPDVFVLPGNVGKAENKQTGWSRGFDVVLGNPPWERLKLAEQEWFAQRNPSIANAANAAARKKLIAKLEEEDISLFLEFNEAQRFAEGEAHLLRSTGRFPLCGVGRDINSASVLTETMRMIVEANGKLGCVVPSAIATDNTTKLFFRDLMESDSLDSLYDFENRNGIFPGVHRSYKFCLLTISGSNGTTNGGAELQFFALDPLDAGAPDLTFRLNGDDISLINPNTMTCPVFRSKRDAEVTKYVYRRLPVILREEGHSNVWEIKTRPGLFHMSNHSHLFQNEVSEAAPQKPLYEAKMIHQFDHRWADYVRGDAADITSQEKSRADYFVVPRYWVETQEVTSRLPEKPEWILGVRDICRNTDERTTITSIMPATAIGGTLMILESDANTPSLFGLNQATFNCFMFDYVSRQKVAGTHLNPSIFKQLPILPPKVLARSTPWESTISLATWLLHHVLELTYTAWDLKAFALDCGYDGPPFHWDEERRFLLRCELDAAYFHLYLGEADEWGADNPELREMFPTPRDAVDYIMDTFPIVCRKDIKRTEVKDDAGEVVTPGTYITKNTILDIYDEMATSIATVVPYQTRLDPPPGPPTDHGGNFIPMAQWDQNKWPSHIHAPRENGATNE